MTKEELKAFTESVNAHRLELAEKFLYLDLCTEAYNEQEKRFNEIYTRVLQAGDYRVGRPDYEPKRAEDPKPGDRITTEDWMFLLSDEDFKRVMDIAGNIFIEEGLTDEQGRYKTNWLMLKLEAERDVNEFFIRKIVPEQLQWIFWDNRWRVVVMEKMRKIARQMI